MTKLDPEERHQVHNARILELAAGEISGKEFVESLIKQVGFNRAEAMTQWQAMRDEGMIAIYDKIGCRVMVEYPITLTDPFGLSVTCYKLGMVTELYGSGMGAVVQTGEDIFSARVPFAVFELRLAK